MTTAYQKGWVVLLCLLSTSLFAQLDLTATKYQSIPAASMPLQDNTALLARELAARKPGRMPEFAVALPVKIRPTTHGEWTTDGNTAVWRERIISRGAKTLNLGFSEYNLPAGAELRLITQEETVGPFTVLDNEDHNQLWTPVVGGDELMIELRVPADLTKRVRLYLTFVNHDFVDVRGVLEKSGSCNLDVVCGEADGWPIVDGYRDIIRSVAALHSGGTGFCTGFLVNNANQDGKPFFMTASHCSVDEARAASMVTYWNFESEKCREVGSAASGGDGGGSLNTFNTGARLLADYPPSDVTLLLLDDPVAADADAFFAGWSADPTAPIDTVIAVHHPSVDEKRISFAFTETFRAPYLGLTEDPEADHITIDDWDIGTTEGGSSGSPIFDRFKRVRGQLHGGFAACGNDRLDSYGFFHTSWEGGGTPATGLRWWLDPCNTGVTTIDGFDQADIGGILTADENCLGGCSSATFSADFTLGQSFPAGTALSVISSPDVLNPTLTTTTATSGDVVSLNVTAEPGTNGVFQVIVRAEGGGLSDDISFTFDLVDNTPTAPVLTFPNNGAADIFPIANFVWAPTEPALSYELQLSQEENFATLLENQSGLTEPALNLGTSLTANTTYYWRVRSVNDCGTGEWQTATFTTADISCAAESSTDTPVEIIDNGPVSNAELNFGQDVTVDGIEVSVVITHTFVGDLTATLTSPAGTVVELFGQISGGSCGGINMNVSFSDDAVATQEDLLGTCEGGDPAVSGSFQPASPLAALNGQSAAGRWVLGVTDNAGLDVGEIVDFSILFCSGEEIKDLSVAPSVTSLDVCIDNDPSTVDVTLGEDFVGDVTLRAEAGGQMLDNFSFDYNRRDRVLTVDFTAWTLVGPGAYTLVLTARDEDGNERSAILDLNVRPNPGAADLLSPDDGAVIQNNEVTVSWARTAGTATYTVEYSTTADFATVFGSINTAGTEAVIGNLPEADSTYWRVVSTGPCGQATSDVRRFKARAAAVHDFGGDRSLNLYPNPVQRFLTVEATGNWSAGVAATLFSAGGRSLRTFQLQSAGRATWDLGVLPAGVYYLRLTSEGQQRTERLVVMP